MQNVNALEPLRLDGTTIVLEPLEVEHTDALTSIGLDPELWRLTTIEVRTAEEMRRYVEEALEARDSGSALPFVVVDRATGDIIGSTRFHSFDARHRRIEIGFSWLVRSRQRTGANTEAKYLLLSHAFESLGCIRVQFRADAENAPSRRALERIGASFEGVLRSFVISRTKGTRSLAMYSIVREEWPKVKSRLQAMMSTVR